MKSRQETITRPPLEVLSTAKQIAMSRGWRVHGATATKLEIKTGISDGLNIEVLSGLKKGDRLVERPPKEIS